MAAMAAAFRGERRFPPVGNTFLNVEEVSCFTGDGGMRRGPAVEPTTCAYFQDGSVEERKTYHYGTSFGAASDVRFADGAAKRAQSVPCGSVPCVPRTELEVESKRVELDQPRQDFDSDGSCDGDAAQDVVLWPDTDDECEPLVQSATAWPRAASAFPVAWGQPSLAAQLPLFPPPPPAVFPPCSFSSHVPAVPEPPQGPALPVLLGGLGRFGGRNCPPSTDPKQEAAKPLALANPPHPAAPHSDKDQLISASSDSPTLSPTVAVQQYEYCGQQSSWEEGDAYGDSWSPGESQCEGQGMQACERERVSRRSRPQQSRHSGAEPRLPLGTSFTRGRVQTEQKMPAGSMGCTTVMIRNIPEYMTQAQLLDEMDKNGFKDLYDFCYMPSSFSNGRGKGFAFTNFVSAEAAEKMFQTWHGRHYGECRLNISVAEIQGLEANLAKWSSPRMQRIKNPRLKPFVRACVDGSVS
eukprot:TRINITY_DN46486_c0_g1_i1.p1 TRINITY_DN46486_c0_g1~~TRINITY_DN46486_c0_g1_i1.p1  ORF type:complete len:467 (-),score=75.49 TRINITY_DN46486_c0_g1_i1:135-1535(-)